MLILAFFMNPVIFLCTIIELEAPNQNTVWFLALLHNFGPVASKSRHSGHYGFLSFLSKEAFNLKKKLKLQQLTFYLKAEKKHFFCLVAKDQEVKRCIPGRFFFSRQYFQYLEDCIRCLSVNVSTTRMCHSTNICQDRTYLF